MGLEVKRDVIEFSITSKLRDNPWILTTIVLGILSLLLVIGSFNATGINNVSKNKVSQSLIDFYESQGISGLSLVSVDNLGGFYEVILNYEGESIPFYVTKSGYLTGNSIVPLDFRGDGPGFGDLEDYDGGGSVLEVSADDDAVKGDPNAPVTIVEFTDYECPFCGRHHDQTLPLIISEYVDTGKVKIVVRDFPLDFHVNAQKAAEAAECAGEFGDDKYWDMHDKLFEEGVAGGEQSFKQYAAEIGLNVAQFSNCLDSGQMESEVLADLQEGSSYGVSGTPGFFINGVQLSGAQPFSEFKKVIEAELAKL